MDAAMLSSTASAEAATLHVFCCSTACADAAAVRTHTRVSDVTCRGVHGARLAAVVLHSAAAGTQQRCLVVPWYEQTVPVTAQQGNTSPHNAHTLQTFVY